MRCVSVCLVGASALIILCGLAGAKTASSIPPPGRAARAHEAIPTSQPPMPQSTASTLGSDSSFEGDIGASPTRSRYAGDDTLWIFDADFEDLEGDNAGWVSFDRSGVPGTTDYWHKDTIRINGFTYLGDSTWWCGTSDPCWRQPRGYGNNWRCDLSREFALGGWSNPGDAVTFEWDQRYAMERGYDYGYVDVSTNGGASWTTVKTFTNGGVTGAGQPRNWNHSTQGHITLNMNTYAGHALDLRFRFESDDAYSSEDEPDNAQHSVEDGAWQLDNFKWKVNGSSVWYDDCESPGSNGWVHDDIAATGQTGIVFQRVYNPDPLRPPGCIQHRRAWWMAAVDSTTGRMVDGEYAVLRSPPIDISGADRLVGESTRWVDCLAESGESFGLDPASSDNGTCWEQSPSGPDWWTDWMHWDKLLVNWRELAGAHWLRIDWLLVAGTPVPPEVHRTGFMLDRQRVGVPIGGPPTVWDYGWWDRFHDWFAVAPALADYASVTITDDDGIASAFLVASNDGGEAWNDYALELVDPEEGVWSIPPPTDLIGPATEIRYYFESTDSTGVTLTLPLNAPDAYFEFSVLPIIGSVEEPGILLVDKHGRTIPGEDFTFRRTSEYYFREALDVLGYKYDVYDVPVPGSSWSSLSNGPDTSGMKYYDTQVWFSDEFNNATATARDQRNLINWLNQSPGKERNLLLTGNDIGYDLIQVGNETLSFYTTWLGSHYVQNQFGAAYEGNPTLRDAAGGFAFMTYDDGTCLLWDW
jgi:hypothetical protein